ncbi:MAG: ABC transporter substrate-binding protein, partial [Streptomycetaceae bacterium]|nr:ABC transporter substrate-binding protein [Streptomycetaceae bacterium]
MTPTFRPALRRAGAAAAVLALSLVSAACTIEDKDKASAGAAPGDAAARTDTPGVTADSIKLGIAYPDYAEVKSFVNIDQGDFEAGYKALIDKINADGGIQGRKIVPVFGKTSLVSPASATETCVKLTQDAKVFAVINNLPGNAQVPCFLQTYRTAVIGSPLDTEMNAAAQAPWFSFETGRIPRKSVEAMAARGDLAGRKVAVVTVSNDQAQTDSQVLPALQAAGITPVSNGTLTMNGADPAALGQQA